MKSNKYRKEKPSGVNCKHGVPKTGTCIGCYQPTQPPLQGKQDWEKKLEDIVRHHETYSESRLHQVAIDETVNKIVILIQSAIHKTEKRMIEEIKKIKCDLCEKSPCICSEDIIFRGDIIEKLLNHSKQG